jgi:hypothetical protein
LYEQEIEEQTTTTETDDSMAWLDFLKRKKRSSEDMVPTNLTETFITKPNTTLEIPRNLLVNINLN